MSKWKIEFKPSALKELKKLDAPVQKDILTFLNKLLQNPTPRISGNLLKGNLKSFWRYRIGNYRAICDIEDRKLLILVLRVGHRKEIYKNASH